MNSNDQMRADLAQMCRESGTPLLCANGKVRYVIGAPKHFTTMAEFCAWVQANTTRNQRPKRKN